MEEEYAGWLTKKEAIELTGWKERTLERYLTQGFIDRATRSIPGTRPVTILNPDQIKGLLDGQKQVVPKTPQVLKTIERKPTRDVALVRQPPPIVRQIAAAPPPVPIEKKVFLSLGEAEQYVGLPASYLTRLIRGGQLAAIRYGGYKIKRLDLEQIGGAVAAG